MKSDRTEFNSARREFFKTGVFALGAAFLSTVLGRGRASLALADAPKVVEESDPLAQAMGYKKDATKVDTTKFPKRAGADGKTQFCNNCQFFKAVDKTKGTCQILQNNLVMPKGWCNSWTKKT